MSASAASAEDAVSPPLPADQFEAELYAVGVARYHDKHPFNLRMHAGQLSREEFRLWVRNHFYFQRNLPVKDAVILTKLPSAADRRAWLRRITDQADPDHGQGGFDAWLRLGEAVGFTAAEMLDEHAVLPGVRAVVDAYVSFCREQSWLEGVASSLTDLFAPSLYTRRIADVRRHYRWLPPAGLDYFRNRLAQQHRDLDHIVPLVLRAAATRQQQQACLAALSFKCDVLWALLDAVEEAAAQAG